MWSWIRKNIFRIYRGGKHRTDGLSTAEKAAFQGDRLSTIEQDRLAYVVNSPVMAVPVVAGLDGHREPTAAQRSDYVPRQQDWTTDTGTW